MMLVGLAELYYCTTTLSCNEAAPGMSVRGQTAAVTLVALEALVAGTFLSYLHTRRVRWLAFKRVEAVRSAARRGVAHRRAASTACTALDLVASAQQGLLDTAAAAASAAGLSAGAVDLPTPDLGVKGALTVFVLRARGLESTDRNGLADPYVKVTVGSTTRKTKVMPRTLDPEWFERLGFEGVLRDIVAKPVQVVVYDRDVLTRDDKLGQRARYLPCSLSFIDASRSRLSGEDGKQGLLSLEVGWAPQTDPSPAASTVPSAGASPTQPRRDYLDMHARGELAVHLFRGGALAPKGSSSSADPYVVASIGRQRRKLQPEWDERLTFDGVLSDFMGKVLHLQVLDKGRFRSEPLSECEVPLEPILCELEESAAPVVRWELPLTATGPFNATSGHLTIAIDWLERRPAARKDEDACAVAAASSFGGAAASSAGAETSLTSGEAVPRAPTKMPSRMASRPAMRFIDAHAYGEIEVHVRSAQNLEAKDARTQSSDPYVLVRLGRQRRRSRVVKRSLFPLWDERLAFEGFLGELVQDETLLVKVLDHDIGSTDDDLGELELELGQLLSEGSITLTDVPLAAAKHGSISLSVSWYPFEDIVGPWERVATCGRIPSKRQRAEPRSDRVTRGVVAVDLAFLLGISFLASADLIYRVNGCGPLGIVTDIAALWTRFLTLESTSTERGVWWLLSVLSMATALPYLLFLLPTIGVILLRLELTGYDKRGTLRSVLSHRKMVKLHYMQNEGAKPRGGRGRVGKKRSAVGALVGSAVGTLVGQRYTALI
ncbi:hypothetical protein EMIHUDRAFT_223391 [Emiliania huxleyi CCMP1516]|uniref:C2 domain-containing protein n=2 Tax=Emiliania huxleyi TaxID=2903 RepID=A0A0D3J3C2_EMIH1|nr:hypothetical protein EMIHUDRAFT_196024 [Emiliania huxleyi CCMP1516]XP_005792265.1 hypothetical protein EMIHUDRAFT_223391 [Emiliania huxleyi CCMP1516]EOD18007.1 hypothetical protein EMIHUDRAFT_196024 [Emiliania huxleyi CCMP1516]EOD39836.1 hypothetical protein EMIHUDRAFT_223391 [Emiliania huxleyi CCMP1516]|eukprot:XP_005770436.1 hypothetical protein EMIHUDRAFT_196024 [Emiliania huxleyi CCMP1516]